MGNNQPIQNNPVGVTHSGGTNIAALLPPDGQDPLPKQPELQFSEKDLEYIQSKEADDAYGEIRIYRCKNILLENQEKGIAAELEICLKNKIFDTKEDCVDYFEEVKVKQQLQHPHLVPLVKCSTTMNNNLCTNIYKTDLAYLYEQHNLEIEILDRFHTKLYFEENDIFDLIEQVMSALYYLKLNGLWHGDIQPKTILIDINNLYKITDIQFLTSGMCGYRKHLAGIETENFLAPELLSALRRQIILAKDEVDQERADIFSLGLVALAMSTLQNVDVIYDFDEYVLKEEEILNLLEIVKNQYSSNLYLLLVAMLNQVERRVDLETGLNLIDQMRSGQFNLEEYEQQKFQQELEQSEKRLAESGQKPFPSNTIQSQEISQFNSNSFVPQIQDPKQQIPNHSQHPRVPQIQDPQQHLPNPQQQQLPSNRDLQNQQAYNEEQELLKKMNFEQIHPQNPQKFVETFEQTPSKSNILNSSDQKKPQLQPNFQNHAQQQLQNDPYQLHPQQQQQQQLPRPQHYQEQQYQIPNSHQNAGYNNYPPNNSTHPNENSVQREGQTDNSLQDIDQRIKQALQRSKQVSLKFENSPLRLFRDQILSDELYVPPDSQQQSYHQHNSRHHHDSSQRKNIPVSQSKSSQHNPYQQGQKPLSENNKRPNSDQKQKQQQFIQKKWKI